jgi:hypothetical protein
MAVSSSPRSSVATICGPAAPDEDFKTCCMDSGRCDGANRNDYLQAVTVAPARRRGPVAGLVGIEGGVVSGVINLESLGVRAPSRRPRHENRYHDA